MAFNPTDPPIISLVKIVEYRWLTPHTIELTVFSEDGYGRFVLSSSQIGSKLMGALHPEGSGQVDIDGVLYVRSGTVMLIESRESVDIEKYEELEEHLLQMVDPSYDFSVMPTGAAPARLERVIDGDTIEVINENGEKEVVRLVGINAPELNTGKSLPPEMGAEEARDYLASLIGHKGTTVYIERSYKDGEPLKDDYGRTLAVVWYGGKNINKQMVLSEHAKLNYLEHQRFFNEHDISTWDKRPEPPIPSSFNFDEMAQWGEGISWDHADWLDNRRTIRGIVGNELEPGETWIGDCRFRIPPLSIQVHQANVSQRITPLRTRGSIQANSGHTMTRIRIELYFDGIEDLNGRKITHEIINGKRVELSYPYYIDGLRPLLAQFMSFPFLPIENRFLNNVMGIDAVALHNLVARTVPGFPGVVQVTLDLTQFDLSTYIYDEDDMSRLIHWPLFRWHVQQKMLPPALKDRKSHTTLWPIPLNGLSNDFAFGFIPSEKAHEFDLIDEKGLEEIEDPLSEIRRAQNILAGIEGVALNEWEPKNNSQKRYVNSRTVEKALEQYEAWNRGELDWRHSWEREKYFYPDYSIPMDPRGPSPTFIMPLYDLEELGIDETLRSEFKEIKYAGTGQPIQIKAGQKLYMLPASKAYVLERMKTDWVSYYTQLESEAAITEVDLRTLVYRIPDLHLVALEFNLNNVLSTIQMDAHEVPTHQYLGAQDTYIRMTFETSSEAAVEALQRLMDYSRELARSAADGVVAGFLTFRNDLTRLFGIEALLIEDVQISTIAGQPGSYRIEVIAFDFKRAQRSIEAMQFLHGAPENEHGETTVDDLERINTPGNLSWPILQKKIAELEAYPDLELPTYTDLMRFANRMGLKFKLNPRRGKYVDPDFFIYPTTRLTEMLAEVLKDPEPMKLESRPDPNDPDDVADAWSDEAHVGRWIGPRPHTEANDPIRAPGSQPFNPEAHDASLNIKAITGTITSMYWLDQNTSVHIGVLADGGFPFGGTVEVNNVDPNLVAILNLNDSSRITREQNIRVLVEYDEQQNIKYVYKLERQTSKADEYTPQPDWPDKAFFEGHFDMMFKHDKRGRLVRAFPGFGIFLVDEGQQVYIYRIFDSLYGIRSLLSLDVTKDKNNAAHLAVITFTDFYRQFRSRRGEKVYDPTTASVDESAPGIFVMKPSQRMIDSRKRGFSAFEILTGARVHIRLGYGSDISQYPISFNGTVTEIQAGEVTTLVCQGDGIELTNVPSQSEFAHGTESNEPRNAIMSLLMGQGSWLQEIVRNWSGGAFFNVNSNGIAHFGRVALEDGVDWGQVLTSLAFGAGGAAGAGVLANVLATAIGATSVGAWPLVLGFLLAGSAAFVGYGIIKSLVDHINQERQERPWIEGEMGDNIYSSNGHGVFVNVPEDAYGALWWFRFIASPFQTLKEYAELLVTVKFDGMTIWDIIQTYAMCTPDYVVSVEPFELRSTLFFGKPYFGIAYEYEEGFKPDYSRPPVEREFYRRKHLKRRPFIQFYYLDSVSDIIRNEIHLSKETVFTNVQVVYHDTGGQKTMTVHADRNIRATDQRTVTVYSPIVAKAVGGTFMKELAWKLLNLTGPGEYDLAGLANRLWGLPPVHNFAVNSLKEFLGTMYRGRLMILGTPGIKPGDIVHLNDTYEEMYGPFRVAEVTTTLSVETGMITSVVPEAYTVADDPYIAHFALWGSTVAAGLATAVPFLVLHRYGVLQAIFEYVMTKLPSDVALEVIQYIREGSLHMHIDRLRERAGSAIDDVLEFMRRSTTMASRRFRFVRRWMTRGGNIIRAGQVVGRTVSVGVSRAAQTVAARTILKSLLKIGGGWLATEAIAVIAAAGLSNIKRWLKKRMPVTMILMTWRGREFSAGITGHKGLVYGDQLGTMEKWIEKLTFGWVKFGMGRSE